ncbi:DUF3099 domain-containing protein [Enteractinococcus coprophilus]|uniref:DUF3099 family protein n=1 Tax=Enteractinococcus coprophilus TaxID=1027633 RepID=A0A543AJA1_9MICC|nr:DUF3099 domain-containing protein [Enteractinococcus coprophilus]TQL72650.1 DUF3099 family protein [Enteractinococcus coprophilus]
MSHQSKSSSRHQKRDRREHKRLQKKADHQVYLITGASESVVADSERKNRIYAVLIGVRIASLFVVLLTHGWVQIAVFIGGMLAPWIGVQIANNIRQVENRSITTVPPQQAALEAAKHEAEESDDDAVIIGDVIDDASDQAPRTPSAESAAGQADLDQDEKKI